MIKKVHIENLQKFMDEHSNDYDHLPISFTRVQSYIHNPKRNNAQPVLYLILEKNNVIAYISALHESFNITKTKLDTVWLSSVWVHSQHRRKGLANRLFEEVYKDYSGNIFATNAGQGSHQLLTKSGNYSDFKTLVGHRFYYRLTLSKILPIKFAFFSKIKPLLITIDFAGNLLLNLKSNLFKRKTMINVQAAEFNSDLKNFINKHTKNSLFQRNTEEFKWIIEYPWVEEKYEETDLEKKYHFTTSAKRFEQKALVVKANDEVKGFIFYNIKDEEMMIHYIFYESEKDLNEFLKLILNEIKALKISHLTIGDERLKNLLKNKGGYLYSKVWKKDFFVGNKLLENHPEILKKDIYMGDGDSIFT